VKKTSSAPSVESALPKPTTVRKHSSSDNISLKSALCQRTSPRPDFRKAVSFVDPAIVKNIKPIRDISLPATPQTVKGSNESKIQKSQKELDDTKRKRSDHQLPPSNKEQVIVVDIPEITGTKPPVVLTYD
jgi:hypothetical protein